MAKGKELKWDGPGWYKAVRRGKFQVITRQSTDAYAPLVGTCVWFITEEHARTFYGL